MQIKDYQIVLLGALIAVGSILSTLILSGAVVEYQKLQNQTIRVTGSASKNITSDSSSWTIRYSAQEPTLKASYAKLANDAKKIKEFFKESGFEETALNFSVVDSYPQYKKFPGSYNNSNEIEYYNASQSVTVRSNEVNKLTELSKKVNVLVNKDVNLESGSVQYFVSNLDRIKRDVACNASKNAKDRAISVVMGTKGRIGAMTSAKLGVFQIVPVDSTAVDDYGINDTSSIEKKVVATVSATFLVK